QDFRVAKIPDGGVERVGRANSAQVFFERGMEEGPMRAGIGGQKNGSGAAHDPANFFRGSGARDQIHNDIARLPRPGSAAIAREFDHARMAGFSGEDRKSTRLNSSHLVISYAVFCLKKKKKK